MNRVARRLAEGIELRSSDPYGYFCGVAHLVFKESLRRAAGEQRVLAEGGGLALGGVRGRRAYRPPPRLSPRVPGAGWHRTSALWLLRYHQGANSHGETNIRNRQALASETGLPMNALRIRVHRIRRKLESCVHDRGCGR